MDLNINQLLSYFTDKPIFKGNGNTVDDAIKPNFMSKRKVSRVTVKYTLKEEFTIFELLQTNIDKDTNIVLYTLISCASGEKMVVSKNAFDLLFERSAR